MEPVSAENTGVEALSPWWVVLGLAGVGAIVGESRFLFCYLLSFGGVGRYTALLGNT